MVSIESRRQNYHQKRLDSMSHRFALEANRGTCGIKTLSVIHRLLGDGATSLQDNL